jgi:hypothetical protein
LLVINCRVLLEALDLKRYHGWEFHRRCRDSAAHEVARYLRDKASAGRQAVY